MLKSVEDLERETGVSKYTWRAWLRQGRLEHVRLGRRVLVPAESVQRFIDANRVPARLERQA
jgi:excisionase family DNA binding protein